MHAIIQVRRHCVPLALVAVLLVLTSGNVMAQAAAVPCFGGDEPYTAETLPDFDIDSGLPCRLPTDAERAAHRGDFPAGSAEHAARVIAPAPRGWNGQGAPAREASSSRTAAGEGFNGGSFTGTRKTQATVGYGGTGNAANANPYASGQIFVKARRDDDASVTTGNDYASDDQTDDETGDDSQTPTGYEQYATPAPDVTPDP